MTKTLKRGFEKVKTAIKKNPVKTLVAALAAYRLISKARHLAHIWKDPDNPALNKLEQTGFSLTNFPGRDNLIGTKRLSGIYGRWRDRRVKRNAKLGKQNSVLDEYDSDDDDDDDEIESNKNNQKPDNREDMQPNP